MHFILPFGRRSFILLYQSDSEVSGVALTVCFLQNTMCTDSIVRSYKNRFFFLLTYDDEIVLHNAATIAPFVSKSIGIVPDACPSSLDERGSFLLELVYRTRTEQSHGSVQLNL